LAAAAGWQSVLGYWLAAFCLQALCQRQTAPGESPPSTSRCV
jgi:hypothetical protein